MLDLVEDVYANSVLEEIFSPETARRRRHFFTLEGPIKKEDFENMERRSFVHYTDAEAALSIIRNKELWLRSALGMVDYSELQSGYDLIRDWFATEGNGNRFEQVVDSIHDGSRLECLTWFDNWWNSTRYNTYIASLSEHDRNEDDHGRLSMWRAFGSHAKTRVALVISPPPISPDLGNNGINFIPVSYHDRRSLWKDLEDCLSNIREHADRLKQLSRNEFKVRLFMSLVVRTVATKHVGFAEEREWRLIYVPSLIRSEVMQVETRVVGGVPQIIHKFPLASDRYEKLSFEDIFSHMIIGPTQYGAPILEAMHEVLSHYGLSQVGRVRISGIPIRS